MLPAKHKVPIHSYWRQARLQRCSYVRLFKEMVTSSDALTLRHHTVKGTRGSNTFILSSNDPASWEKQVSVTMLGYKLKARQKYLFALRAVCFYMQIVNLMIIRHQKICCTDAEGHQGDHESWSAVLPQKCCGSRPELVLISCPVLLCIRLPTSHLPLPMLQLPAGGTGSQANTVPWGGAPRAELLCRSGRAVNRGVIACCVEQRRSCELPTCAAVFTVVEVIQKKKGLCLYL